MRMNRMVSFLTGFSSYGGMSPRRLGGGPMNMLCGGVPALGFPSRVGPDQSRECMNSFTQTPTLPSERSNRNARHRVMLGIILYRPMRKSLKLPSFRSVETFMGTALYEALSIATCSLLAKTLRPFTPRANLPHRADGRKSTLGGLSKESDESKRVVFYSFDVT